MKLSNITAKAIFSVAFVSIFLTFIISIVFQFKSFENEIEKIKKDYIQLKKDEIQREVTKVFNTIDAQEKKLKIDIERKLKHRVDIAYNIAMSIYHENRDKKTKEEIQYLIVAALKNINFSENRAYYFINNWLDNFAYHASFGWQLYVFPILLIVLITVISVGQSAIKAAIANPIKSLRTE